MKSDEPIPFASPLINRLTTAGLAFVAFGSTGAPAQAPDFPIQSDYSQSVLPRWLAKRVQDSRLLDNCESLSTWTTATEDQGSPEISLTSERAMDGSHCLRLRSRTTGPKPIPHGRYYGTSSAVRVVKEEDWSAWNRLSFWVYPDLKGFRNVSLIVILHNNGKEKMPDTYGKMGKNYVLLKNHQWNHVVWEIGNLSRDKISGVEFAYRVQGHEPGATDTVQYDIDKLELQKVHEDYFEGWAVAPGAISFSHAGYQIGSPKSALASDLTAKTFSLLDAQTGAAVLTKEVKHIETSLGKFQVLDFTEWTKPGTYIVKSGGRQTKPFRIGDSVWESSLWKAINFFYTERCGFAVPGVHDVCHADWVLKHKNQSIVVNGGWHDAGDLSQNLTNTSEAAYAMFALAERLQNRNENPALLKRLLEEANWGLQFVLKTTFHDGYRTGFNTMDRWTDGIIGTDDDMLAEASKSASISFSAAGTEAIAARVLRASDPILADRCLQMAREDWKFGVEMLDHPEPPKEWELSAGARFWRSSECEQAAHAAIASIELFKTTGDRVYADKAAGYGRYVTSCQEKSILPGMDYPITGFFYTDPSKKLILRYAHLSHEEAPMIALAGLCEALPQHPDWMSWYSAVTLYSKYFQVEMAKFTAPYGMLANSIYRDDEYKDFSPGDPNIPQQSYRDQVTNGVKVGDHYFVRRFPVWFEFRGNHGTTLAQATGLAEAAHLRGDYSLHSQLQEQLQWVIGRNPFVQSTMWGEGYDYAPQYTAMSGDLVGSLPVGIQTHRDEDVPYWPTENCHNWKEVWVVPTGRWIWLMKNLSGTAILNGMARDGKPVTLRNLSTGQEFTANPSRTDRKISVSLPSGEYEVSSGPERRTLTLLSGGTYQVDLQSEKGVQFTATQQTDEHGAVHLSVKATGAGKHHIRILAQNVEFEASDRVVSLNGSAQSFEWKGVVKSQSAPWIAVVTADGDQATRKEISGLAWRARR